MGGDERVEIKEILKIMDSGAAKNVKCDAPELIFLVICESDMLRNSLFCLLLGRVFQST